MLFSHEFGSLETRNRAHFWLTWHGFAVQEPRRADGSTGPSHRLAVQVSLAKAAAVQALVDSIEHSDPHAWPAITEAAPVRRWIVDEPAASPFGSSQPAGTPIHWQSRDEAAGDATAARVAEYMFSRWE